MKKSLFILIFILIYRCVLFAQEIETQKELLERANESIMLLSSDPQKAFKQAKEIEKEAQKISAKEAELRAINIQCGYYKTKNDFNNMLVTGNLLFHKAGTYKLPVYQSIANTVLFDAYMFNNLYDKAFQELQEGMKIIDKTPLKDSLSIMVKLNLFNGYTNYYAAQEDFKNQIKYSKLRGKLLEEMSDGELKSKWLFTHYANMGTSFKYINLDSAKHYVKVSLSEDRGYEGYDEVRFLNMSTLGDVAVREENYKEALSYFKEAEKLSGYKNHINIRGLYENFKQIYQKLEIEDSLRLYEFKIDSLDLAVSKNQNKTLYQLLDEKADNDYKKYIHIFGAILIAMGGVLLLVIRKNKNLIAQDKTSQQYLENVSKNPKGDDYSKLMELLKKNDPAFMFYFNETFPEFSPKLKDVNSKISVSEIEFCALLKLKLDTKDIAKYIFRAPQTIRNKKSIIRKRLYIPKDVDIYEWFDGL